MKRVLEFIRSVIPGDPWQLLFLAGIVCLIASHGLRWWPASFAFPEDSSDSLRQSAWYMGWIPVYFIIFSAPAGYYLCFWPGKRAPRRIFWLVCVPALLGLSLMFSRVLYLSSTPPSVFESGSSALSRSLRFAESTLWKLPPGFHFTLLGLLLIAVFTSRVAFGISRLPLALPTDRRLSQSQDSESWRRLQFLVFVVVGPLFLIDALVASVGLGISFVHFSSNASFIESVWFTRLSPTAGSLVACLVLLWIMGRDNRQIIQGLVWRPDRKSLLLALTFPAMTCGLISIVQFLFDRAQWAAHDVGRLASPELAAYFNFSDPWLFLLFIPALYEEVIFRGLLQSRFIQRYGVHRGIFLVGIVWGAFHFYSDFSFFHFSDLWVLLQLGFRLFGCISHSFVLGWLTLRSRSVIPAATAHALYNAIVSSDFSPPFAGKGVVFVALSAVLAYALFRYWPVRTEDSPQQASDVPSLENAV